jgi:hypothetical protein
MEKSFVGDPIFWPGLIYAPLNINGLIFAFGSISQSSGMIFEEFGSDNTAVCRRKTDRGWEKIRVAFVMNSSQFDFSRNDIDLVICWHDDSVSQNGIPLQALSKFVNQPITLDNPGAPIKRMENILPDDAAESLAGRAQRRENFEDTVRQLDSQIKRLQGN